MQASLNVNRSDASRAIASGSALGSFDTACACGERLQSTEVEGLRLTSLIALMVRMVTLVHMTIRHEDVKIHGNSIT